MIERFNNLIQADAKAGASFGMIPPQCEMHPAAAIKGLHRFIGKDQNATTMRIGGATDKVLP